MKKVVLTVMAWLLVISAAHLALNVNWDIFLNERVAEKQRKLNVAYIPVT